MLFTSTPCIKSNAIGYIILISDIGGYFMNNTRKDSWQAVEDRLLANTVLTYIKEGKSQLQAFENVSSVLGRTAAGVGFRWNGTIRRYYEDDIVDAKRIKKLQEINPIVQANKPTDAPSDSIDVLIDELISMDNTNKETISKIEAIRHSMRLLEEQLGNLRYQLSKPIITPEIDSEDIRALKLMFKKANEIMQQQENKKPAI